jgi:hypothetical protein
MKKLSKQPFKIIDDFFESAPLWQAHAQRQEFSKTEFVPGMISKSLDELNLQLFHALASKLIAHSHGKKYFRQLTVNYSWVDESFNTGWISSAGPTCNVAGLIFLNPSPAKRSGVSMYQKTGDNNINYAEILSNEIMSTDSERNKFVKYKQDQEKMFKKTMYVENVFNRCVMFAADEFYRDELYFGKSVEDSRLVIRFSGFAE